MALVLGIYTELLASVRTLTLRSFWLDVRYRQWRQAADNVNSLFLLVLGAGILSAVLLFSHSIVYLLEHRPLEIWSFFLGLVLASTVLVGHRIKHWNISLACICLGAAILAFGLVGQVPLVLPTTWWFLLLSGALAVCAMILPGISGSYILVLLGQYHTVLTAVNERDVTILGLVALGASVGLLTFTRVLSWLLHHYPRGTLAVLTGLLLGSLRRIWPWQAELTAAETGEATASLNVWPPLLLNGTVNPELLTALLFAVLGLTLVLGLSWLAARYTTHEEQTTP